MIPAIAIGALLVAGLVVAGLVVWVVRRLLDYRIGDATRALETHDIVCVEAGKRPRWAVHPRDESDEQPTTAPNPERTGTIWEHSVATLNEEAA